MNYYELDKKLNDEGYYPHFYCIGSDWRRLGNVFAVDKGSKNLEFFYVTRGKKKPIKEFTSENEASDFAYDFLTKEMQARPHNVGYYASSEEAEKRMVVLREAGIEYQHDIITYDGGPDDFRYRIFVLGKDGDRISKNDCKKI